MTALTGLPGCPAAIDWTAFGLWWTASGLWRTAFGM